MGSFPIFSAQLTLQASGLTGLTEQMHWEQI